MEEFVELLSLQAKCIRITIYENEFITMQTLREQSASNSSLFRRCRLAWINSLEQNQESSADRRASSIGLRERGNKLYQADPKNNALAACRLYTQAIFAAPLGECLALAHANRAMALQEFGYYQQAYDDCECALQLGYPDKLRHKLWTRQAVCAKQLGDVVLLEQLLDKLSDQTLNEKFAAQIEELRQSMQNMKAKDEIVMQSIERCKLDNHRQSQKILENDEKGRYMVASKFIAENDVIFSEHASSFVPVPEMHLCQNCASIQFIPFPCYDCQGKVVYCSLKCRRLHAPTHEFECAAYQRDLFQYVGIAHLALRIVLDNMQQWSALVQSKTSAALIWKELLDESAKGFMQKKNLSYRHSLHMITHLDKLPMLDILWFAIVSEMLVLYLSEFTDFFEVFSDSNTSRSDVELITGSLILRHIGQLIVNGHTCNSICRIGNENTSDPLAFELMSDNLWVSPGHVLRGHLHQFSEFNDVTVANFPYLSLCNHSCNPSFKPKFSNNTVSTFAVKPIEAGEEIFNSYTMVYRKSIRNTRWNHLRKIYHFECKCFQCSKTNPDEEYNKFHRYRCNQPNCREVFTPQLTETLDDLNWWNRPEGSYQTEQFECSFCHSSQHWLQLHKSFKYELECVQNKRNRQKLYKFFDELDEWLLDYHELKLFYAHEIVVACYAVNFNGFHLSSDEFSSLTKILKFLLKGTAKQTSTKSIEYVAKMTYLWDFIALDRYKPTKDEMKEMLNAITIVSDKMQQLFLNYYNDYIVNKLNV